MAKKEETKAPETTNSTELLLEKIAAMREAQRIFSTYTQEQVDKIFFEAAMAASPEPGNVTFDVEMNLYTMSGCPAFLHSSRISRITSCLSGSS